MGQPIFRLNLNLTDAAINEFNTETGLFDKRNLNQVISGKDFQKKWYLANLAKWHLSRSAN